MSTIIEFRNTNFGFDNTNTFNDFNMEITEGDIVTLIGPAGSGKTTILKMLCNRLPNNSLYYRGINIKNYNVQELKNEIVVVFDEPFMSKTVSEELEFYLKKLNTPSEEIEKRINKFVATFELSSIINIPLDRLSYQDKYLIKILRYLILEPNFIAIDSILANISTTNKKKIINYIKTNNMTLLNVTTNLDEALLGNKLYVLENFVLILEGSTLSVLKTDTLLKRLGFNLPLPVDLSIELNHYDILKKIYTDKQKLVNELWK